MLLALLARRRRRVRLILGRVRVRSLGISTAPIAVRHAVSLVVPVVTLDADALARPATAPVAIAGLGTVRSAGGSLLVRSTAIWEAG